jgi:hypothetical protein
MNIDQFKPSARLYRYAPSRAGLGLTAILIMAVVAAALFRPWGASANGNSDLNQSARRFLRGDVVTSGLGLRGVGFGDIFLDGIPSSASVSEAFLYWSTIGNANTYTSPTLDGDFVSGQLIGTSANTDWPNAQKNFVYRADVTDIVDGNGAYTIAGLPDDLASGNDSQGASLVVIYSDSNEPYRNIIINDGAVTLNQDTFSYTTQFDNYTVDNPVSDAHITYLVADGQEIYDSGTVTFEGDTIGDDVFKGTDGDFWDDLTFDVTNHDPDAPADTTLDIINQNGDYLVWAASIFSVTAGPPQSAENNLAKSFSVMVYGDVTSSGVGLRETGEGDITISGIPFGADVFRSYLYWATLGSVGSFDSPTLNGDTVNGDLIGVSANTCWPGAQNNFVYRADVTDIVNQNGTYSIAGLPDNLDSGNDSQGASLVIIFGGDTSRPLRTIIINDGAVTLDLDTHEYTDTIAGFRPDSPVSGAHVTYLVGDGQAIYPDDLVQFNGSVLAEDVFSGAEGDYWDTLTFDITDLDPADPSTTTIDNNVPNNSSSQEDCLVWAATVFSITHAPPGNIKNYFPLIYQGG